MTNLTNFEITFIKLLGVGVYVCPKSNDFLMETMKIVGTVGTLAVRGSNWVDL